jgi:hypothetical protein
MKEIELFSIFLNPNTTFISSNYKNHSIFKKWHLSFLLGCSLSISCAGLSTELLLFRNSEARHGFRESKLIFKKKSVSQIQINKLLRQNKNRK